MPREELDNLVRVRKLKEERATADEIAGLLRSGLARLKDAGNISLSIESRFDLAYNAAHALSLAALRCHGYRSENRYLVFQCLQHTIDLPIEQWRDHVSGILCKLSLDKHNGPACVDSCPNRLQITRRCQPLPSLSRSRCA